MKQVCRKVGKIRIKRKTLIEYGKWYRKHHSIFSVYKATILFLYLINANKKTKKNYKPLEYSLEDANN